MTNEFVPYSNYIQAYHDQIQKGEVVVGESIRTIYAREVKLLNSEHERWTYDHTKALKVIAFIERFCKQSKGRLGGKRLTLELWQKAALSIIFGFIDRETGYRKYDKVLMLVGRKNGKSTLISALSLYMLIADGEKGARCLTLATKRDQAKIVFDEATEMRDKSPELSKRTKRIKNQLQYPATSSFMYPVSSESHTLDGENPHFVSMDEVAAWKNKGLWGVMTSATGSREQPLIFAITTNNFIRENIFDEIYNYSKQILSGETDDERFLPLLYELDKEDDWTNEKVWAKANPNLGVSKSLETMREDFKRAQSMPSEEREFKTKHLNIPETSVDRWLDYMDIIMSNKKIDLEGIKGRHCVIGLDLSQINDLTAAVFVIPLDNGDKVIIPHFFIAEKMAERKIAEDGVPYDKWRDQGWVTFTPGSKVDYNFVEYWVIDTIQKHELLVVALGYDRHNADYIITNFEKKYGIKCEAVAQGAITFSIPMKTMAADIMDKKMIHNGNQPFVWCLTNTNEEIDKNGNSRPVKDSSAKRIDGMVACLNGYVALERNQEFFNYIKMLEVS